MIKSNSIKIVLFSIWLTTLSIGIYYYLSMGIPLGEITGVFRAFIGKYDAWGPILYIVMYSMRSLIFFPGSLLAAMSGLIFGPLYGILYTLIGENISANISFLVGHYFGSSVMKHLSSKSKLIPYLECEFRENGFLTVLTMRLIYLPFDLVGYVSGLCDIRQRDFALGTLIGTIPGLTTFVLLGSGLTDYRNLILAGIIFVAGWPFSIWLKKKQHLNESLST